MGYRRGGCKFPLSGEDGLLLIRRFLSAIAWNTGNPVEEITTVGGSPNRERSLELCWKCWIWAGLFDGNDNPKALLPLAFYREALNVNSVPSNR